MTKFIFLTDAHGQVRDLETINTARDFASWFKPDWMIGGGDFWDLRCLRCNASEEDQNFPLAEDLACAENTFDLFYGGYAPAKKIYLEGNHDFRRLQRLLNSPRAAIRELAFRLDDEMRAIVNRFAGGGMPYDKRHGVFNIGTFSFIHGYAAGIHAVRKHAISYGNCMFGHIHAFSSHTLEDLSQSTAYSVGCACAIDQEYNSGQIGTLRQENGFAYGFIDESSGMHDIHFARKYNGTFFLPTEWTNG